MKTPFELPEQLAREVEALAADENVTVQVLIERVLREHVTRRTTTGRFRLRDGSYGDGGLTPEFQDAGWEQIRDAIYGDRGG